MVVNTGLALLRRLRWNYCVKCVSRKVWPCIIIIIIIINNIIKSLNLICTLTNASTSKYKDKLEKHGKA